MKSRAKREEQDEVLEQITKDGQEGIKNFVEYQKSEEQKEKELKEKVIEEAIQARKKRLDYNRFLCQVLLSQLEKLIWPKDWTYQVAPTEKGVVFEMKNPDKRIFRAAFASTGEAQYDLNAVEMYVIRAENTLERMKHNGLIFAD